MQAPLFDRKRKLTIFARSIPCCVDKVFDTDVKFVPGVGEARAQLLDRELGIRTVGDLIRHYPTATSTARASTPSPR